MKPWPKDKSPVYFCDLADSIVSAIKFAYKLSRKNRGKSIPWKGYNIGKDDRATCLTPDEQLSAEGLEFNDEDQGRSAIEVIVGLAIQLGIEQGRRIANQKHEEEQRFNELLGRLQK